MLALPVAGARTAPRTRIIHDELNTLLCKGQAALRTSAPLLTRAEHWDSPAGWPFLSVEPQEGQQWPSYGRDKVFLPLALLVKKGPYVRVVTGEQLLAPPNRNVPWLSMRTPGGSTTRLAAAPRRPPSGTGRSPRRNSRWQNVHRRTRGTARPNSTHGDSYPGPVLAHPGHRPGGLRVRQLGRHLSE